jgi:hypothetical protein
LFVSPDSGFAVGDGGTILRSTNGGLSWFSVPSGTRLNLRSIAFATPSNGIAVGEDGIMVASLNGGSSWERVTSPVRESLVDVIALSQTIYFAVGEDGTLLKSTDGGAGWTSFRPREDVAYVLAAGTSRHGIVVPATGRLMQVSVYGPVSESSFSPSDSVIAGCTVRSGEGFVLLTTENHFYYSTTGQKWSEKLEALSPMLDARPLSDREREYLLAGRFVSVNERNRYGVNASLYDFDPDPNYAYVCWTPDRGSETTAELSLIVQKTEQTKAEVMLSAWKKGDVWNPKRFLLQFNASAAGAYLTVNPSYATESYTVKGIAIAGGGILAGYRYAIDGNEIDAER